MMLRVGSNMRRAGFTLLELLAVVAVIAILIALIMGSSAGARKNARIQQSKAELRGLVVAIRAYRVEYGTWPVHDQGGEWNEDNSELVRALVAPGNEHHVNFIEVRDPSHSLCDPFRANIPYKVLINATNDYVEAWSYGPDGKKDGGDDISFNESKVW